MAVTPIEDHAARAARLLPAQHATTLWSELLRALLGVRGAWADDERVWAVRDSAKGTIVVRDVDLVFWFGAGGAASITGAPGSEDFQVSADVLLTVSGLTTAPPFVPTVAEVDAALEADALLSVSHDGLSLQIAEEVTAALAGARRGLQEVEGVFAQLLRLRALSTAAGAQLEGIGDVLIQGRGGQSDDPDYRDTLRLKAAANAHAVTIPRIVDAAAGLTGVVYAQLLEAFPAFFSLYLHGTLSTPGARAVLRQLRARGIGSMIVAGESLNPFVFGPDAGWLVVSIVAPGVYTIPGMDVTSYFSPADVVRVFDVATGTVLHTTSVVAVGLAGPDTEVTVLDDGGVSAPFVLENVTRGAQDDGGPFEDAYEIVGFTGPASFRVDGDATSEFAAGGPTVGHLIRVLASSGDDGVYRVLTVTFALGETAIEVTPTPPAGAGDGQLQHVSPAVAASIDPLLEGIDSAHGEFVEAFVT